MIDVLSSFSGTERRAAGRALVERTKGRSVSSASSRLKEMEEKKKEKKEKKNKIKETEEVTTNAMHKPGLVPPCGGSRGVILDIGRTICKM